MSEWVKLSSLAFGDPFVTQDGRLGLRGHGKTATARIVFLSGQAINGNSLPADTPVLHLDPGTLAADLAELAFARLALADLRMEKGWLIEQERARERGRCANALFARALRSPRSAHDFAMIEAADTLIAIGPLPVPERLESVQAERDVLLEALHATAWTKDAKGHPCWCSDSWGATRNGF